VTPEEDYRTAVPFDSPDAGVRYAPRRDRQGDDPAAKSGLRYSAGRAPRGCGRFILSGLEATTNFVRSAQGRERGTGGLQAGRPEARAIKPSEIEHAPRGAPALRRG
jgi:hypothetical protein